MAWALRKAGVPVPSNPILGSEWMKQKGLLAEPQNKVAGLLGEGAGLAAPVLMVTRAPQIVQGVNTMADALTATRPKVPPNQAGNATVPFLGAAAAGGGAMAAADNPDVQAWIDAMREKLRPR